MKRYNPKDIESKWQDKWETDKIYQATEDTGKPKRYILEYFPYPSGAAMHVGHVRNYTIGDAVARFYRMRGYNVMHPMGWDAFGLPAENYAIKNNISPKQAILENTGKFKQQLMQMGFSYDWSREIDSSDPSYYKWTQWFFKLLYERGLAYQKESLQWWCETDKTVLANEQVEAGKCWRCGNEVTKKALNQWFFKITDYADRLVDDLEGLDWPEAIKSMQRNWIGKSKGAEINFAVEGTDEKLTVFTTRADTLFGATFIVIAPEHELLNTLSIGKQKSEVDKYVKASLQKSEVERQETGREKTGVFTGSYAVNPVNGEKIPVWVADYVLAGYGTGAIMAVPAHDQRDNEFASVHGLPVVNVLNPSVVREDAKDKETDVVRDKIVAVVTNDKGEVLTINWGKLGGRLLVGGTIEDNEAPEVTALREVTEETGYVDLEVEEVGQETFQYKYYAFSKQETHETAVKFIKLALKTDKRQDQKLDESEKNNFSVEWVSREQADREITEPLHRYAYEKFVAGEVFHGEGTLTNSGKYDGMPSFEARDVIVADLEKQGQAKEQVNYKIRDWLISRQRYWGAPIPIIHCEKDGAVPVADEDLPVELPEVKDYRPTGVGSVLATAEDWVNVKCPKCGGPAKRETDTMDGFACSSWYFLRFADAHNSEKPFDPEKVKFWLPVDDYIGGAEHAVMHLLYARMWTKVMFDAGLIDFNEPFKSLRNQGMILAPDGRKMSKSWGNVIAPDDLIEEGYGADSIRLMELFIGPWDQAANWSVEGMGGTFRFLQRVWTLTQEYLESRQGSADGKENPEILKIVHAAIKKVTSDLNDMGFNTATATLMETINQLYKIKAADNFSSSSWQNALETLMQLLAPFAPHMTEELWQQLGREGSVHISEWPAWDEKYLVKDSINLAVQVNGKVRDEITVAADASEDVVVAAALDSKKVKVYVTGEPKKIIYVPGRLVSIVV